MVHMPENMPIYATFVPNIKSQVCNLSKSHIYRYNLFLIKQDCGKTAGLFFIFRTGGKGHEKGREMIGVSVSGYVKVNIPINCDSFN